MIYIISSLVLIPFAWIVGIVDKLSAKNTQYTELDKLCNYLFIPFGLVILMLDMLQDLNYFWKNNFRTELKQNIIVKEKSLLTHQSLRDLDSYAKKMRTNKIKSLSTIYLIKYFRNKQLVPQNIQFLMFA